MGLTLRRLLSLSILVASEPAALESASRLPRATAARGLARRLGDMGDANQLSWDAVVIGSVGTRTAGV